MVTFVVIHILDQRKISISFIIPEVIASFWHIGVLHQCILDCRAFLRFIRYNNRNTEVSNSLNMAWRECLRKNCTKVQLSNVVRIQTKWWFAVFGNAHEQFHEKDNNQLHIIIISQFIIVQNPKQFDGLNNSGTRN